MHPEKTMKRIVNGERYAVSTSTLLASNEYWDGSNWERNGENTFLYRTRNGAFFRVDLTQWQGERDTLEPLTRDEAMALYEELREHDVEYEQAFDAVVEDAAAGRPTLYGKPMKQTAIWLPDEMIDWLKAQPGSMSDVMRDLIDQAMTSSEKK